MVDSPYGVPYPGKWALWRGEWYETRTYSDGEKLMLLSYEGAEAPDPGWEESAASSPGGRSFTRIVPFAELEAYEEFIVKAQWHGYEFGLLRIGADGLATGWAGEPDGRSLSGGRLVSLLDQSGHRHGQAERDFVEATVPAGELTDFRLVRHRNLADVLRKAGW